MLKNLAFICAALIIAAGAFSTNAQAQRHHGTHVVGTRGAHVVGTHFGGRYYRGGYRGRYYGGRGGYYGGGYYYGDDWGWGGFAAGAILGGVLAAQPYYGGDAVGYCMRRFKSYDPGSGTYLGYDGYRHPCP
jgi:hypothetical protein